MAKRRSRRDVARGAKGADGLLRRNGGGAARFRLLGLVGLFALAIGVVVVTGRGRGPRSHHPQPRPDVTAAEVVPAARYASYPRIAEVYGLASRIPEVLDGLYCYCQCSEHAGHYSLLDCFKSDHGANCDVCLSQAALAYRMTEDGEGLDGIRKATDRLFAR